jgi:4-amino-4-deoxy-L-arabinose transferase-like glycosyltransferase
MLLMIYLCGAKLYDYRAGLLAAVLLLFDLNLWNCSQKVWIDAAVTFFFWLALYILLFCGRRQWLFLLAGVIGGLALLAKYSALTIFFIYLTYALIYERHVFKHYPMYLGLILAAAVFSPWIYMNFEAFGDDYLAYMTVKSRLDDTQFFKAGLIVIVLFALMLVLGFLKKDKTAFIKNINFQKGWVIISVAAVGFVAALLGEGDFRSSFINALAWDEMPRQGIRTAMFHIEPWTFYFQQFLKYSPFYYFFLAAVVMSAVRRLAPNQEILKSHNFLWITYFWTMLAGLIYKNYQGRYILAASPAAALLTAYTLIYLYEKIQSLPSGYKRYCFLWSYLAVLTYCLAKTLHVLYVFSHNPLIAYY